MYAGNIAPQQRGWGDGFHKSIADHKCNPRQKSL